MTVHPQLCRDTHALGRFDHSVVLLHRNAIVPWFILVPETSQTEFLALDPGLRAELLEESARTARFVQAYFGSPKINFAAIGNIVPQLHLHVVGRGPGDCCWPNPVWGHLVDTTPYKDSDVTAIARSMITDCDLKPADTGL